MEPSTATDDASGATTMKATTPDAPDAHAVTRLWNRALGSQSRDARLSTRIRTRNAAPKASSVRDQS